uniref:Uncharacterized protein n=1 Tax=Noccaea caerulescens TaxID=107243 RepID=A0A1J3K4K1_NOCCA
MGSSLVVEIFVAVSLSLAFRGVAVGLWIYAQTKSGRSVAARNLAGYLPNGGGGDSGLIGGGSGTVRGCAFFSPPEDSVEW